MHNIQPLIAIDLVQRFRAQRALVIGDALLDSYLEGEAARLSRDGPIPVIRKTTELRLPGGAANVAANLRALEAEVFFLSRVGCDLAGTLLRETLRGRGIKDRWLIVDEAASTPHKMRIVADGQHIARFDEDDPFTAPQTVDSQPLFFSHLEELYTLCDVVVVSDYCYGVVSDALIERLQALHRAHPKVILVDSQALNRFRYFPATVVTPNEQEARLLLEDLVGRPSAPGLAHRPDTLAEVEPMARSLLKLLAAENVTITLAEQGVLLAERGGRATHLPAHPVETTHDVGAGDSFVSALALALAAGGEIEEAVRIGIDAAGLAVTKPRTAVVSYQELLQRVSLRTYTTRIHDLQGSNARATLAQLAAHLEVARLVGRTIVFTNGVFDILHVGHIKFLRQAKALGDILVLAVNSDASARRLKGPGRPINSERDRIALVEALDMVDYAVLFEQDTSSDLIRLLRPQVYVKGSDYSQETLPSAEAEAVREVDGRLVILPLLGSMSTSRVIDRIKATGE
jgi:D-beta-D-heptose 7-phosphate kinase / D-beta-D-heptose 1-phosphate adenosyltransferase